MVRFVFPTMVTLVWGGDPPPPPSVHGHSNTPLGHGWRLHVPWWLPIESREAFWEGVCHWTLSQCLQCPEADKSHCPLRVKLPS